MKRSFDVEMLLITMTPVSFLTSRRTLLLRLLYLQVFERRDMERSKLAVQLRNRIIKHTPKLCCEFCDAVRKRDDSEIFEDYAVCYKCSATIIPDTVLNLFIEQASSVDDFLTGVSAYERIIGTKHFCDELREVSSRSCSPLFI